MLRTRRFTWVQMKSLGSQMAKPQGLIVFVFVYKAKTFKNLLHINQ